MRLERNISFERKSQEGRMKKKRKQRPTKPFQRYVVPILVVLLILGGLFLVSHGGNDQRVIVSGKGETWYDYEIVNTYPHDPSAFTQGLIYRDGYLFESTGLYGGSSLRKVGLKTGEVVQRKMIRSDYFGEGLTDWGDQLVQLTWKSNIGFVYNALTFELERTFRYPGEGWGLTRDNERLIMSDGTSSLRFLDPQRMRETGRLEVTENGFPVSMLNELEMVRGQIFANVYNTDEIVIISPQSGHVTGRISLVGLLEKFKMSKEVDVLNGIAYDPERDRLFVTGKRWPKLFEIRLKETENSS
jgi:glutamine cyclotransferase